MHVGITQGNAFVAETQPPDERDRARVLRLDHGLQTVQPPFAEGIANTRPLQSSGHAGRTAPCRDSLMKAVCAGPAMISLQLMRQINSSLTWSMASRLT